MPCDLSFVWNSRESTPLVSCVAPSPVTCYPGLRKEPQCPSQRSEASQGLCLHHLFCAVISFSFRLIHCWCTPIPLFAPGCDVQSQTMVSCDNVPGRRPQKDRRVERAQDAHSHGRPGPSAWWKPTWFSSLILLWRKQKSSLVLTLQFLVFPFDKHFYLSYALFFSF